MKRSGVFSLLVGVIIASSCNMVQSFIHDDEVVAKVGKHKLYKSELNAYIPSGISSADSTNMALQYINSWATSLIYSDVAVSQLPKSEQDVSAELESYKRSLLRFRYEQQFVNDRLDTLVTEDQMLAFYKANPGLFELERPILRVRYIDIVKTSEQKDFLLKKMASSRTSDAILVDSLANRYAIRYFDNTQSWMDATDLAREFGTDYLTMLSKLKNNYITIESSEMADVKSAYVKEIMRKGTAPFEYCTDRIREYVLSGRKRELLVALEQSLLKEASDRGSFVIY